MEESKFRVPDLAIYAVFICPRKCSVMPAILDYLLT